VVLTDEAVVPLATLRRLRALAGMDDAPRRVVAEAVFAAPPSAAAATNSSGAVIHTDFMLECEGNNRPTVAATAAHRLRRYVEPLGVEPPPPLPIFADSVMSHAFAVPDNTPAAKSLVDWSAAALVLSTGFLCITLGLLAHRALLLAFGVERVQRDRERERAVILKRHQRELAAENAAKAAAPVPAAHQTAAEAGGPAAGSTGSGL
jgi:hypothetical protein